MSKKQVVLMRHAFGRQDPRRLADGTWMYPEGAGPKSPRGRLPVAGFEMVQKVSEWLKSREVGTCAIYHSKHVDPTKTAYALAGELPHVKIQELEILSDDRTIGDRDIEELGTLLDQEDRADGFDTVVFITHQPLVRKLADEGWGVRIVEPGYATTLLINASGKCAMFSPGG